MPFAEAVDLAILNARAAVTETDSGALSAGHRCNGDLVAQADAGLDQEPSGPKSTHGAAPILSLDDLDTAALAAESRCMTRNQHALPWAQRSLARAREGR
jgi:hypothetical protein